MTKGKKKRHRRDVRAMEFTMSNLIDARAVELTQQIGAGRRSRKKIERCAAAAGECSPLATVFLFALSNLMGADVAIALVRGKKKNHPRFTVTFHAPDQKCFGKADGDRLMLAAGDACAALNSNNPEKN